METGTEPDPSEDGLRMVCELRRIVRHVSRYSRHVAQQIHLTDASPVLAPGKELDP